MYSCSAGWGGMMEVENIFGTLLFEFPGPKFIHFTVAEPIIFVDCR
jgi:hypothetical protein